MEMKRIDDEDDDKEDFSQLLECMPEVLQNLKESGQSETFETFCDLVVSKTFPLTNIGLKQ
ncbi:hypothetical protein DPMN_095373 [Dreissena polymorpha]|uniref:Uncharacterized protein n=1 Tax=Dreissena polymorpha TaxID=45954 RepID=A0A9D4L979_DREPO|nr:hypothetical protein DPMN_095373 [Dreissena polymorpha]